MPDKQLAPTGLLNSKNDIDYEDIEEMVEYLASVKSYQNKFNIWETEDIAQEIRTTCYKVLDKFNPEKINSASKIINFFGRCVDNALRNLKRDNYVRYGTKSNPMDEEYVQRQLNIKNPLSFDQTGNIFGDATETPQKEIIASDMYNKILEELPEELHEDFKNLATGGKIRRKTRNRIRRLVKDIIGN